jgi:hypothetical protein
MAHGGASVDDVLHQQAMFALESGQVDSTHLEPRIRVNEIETKIRKKLPCHQYRKISTGNCVLPRSSSLLSLAKVGVGINFQSILLLLLSYSSTGTWC